MTRPSAEDLEIAARRSLMGMPSGLPGPGLIATVVIGLLALSLALCAPQESLMSGGLEWMQ